MKKIILTLCLLVVIIFIVEYINRNRQTSATGDLSIELKIHDSLPKTLTLQKDGTLIFTEGDNKNDVKLSHEEMDSLKQFILDNKFFSLEEEYKDRNLVGGIGHTITVTIGDKSHSVHCYGGSPEGFRNVLEKIKSFWPEEIRYSGWS